MYNPDGQYISVTKEHSNLNIEYQKLKNKNIDRTDRSSFLLNDSDFMNEDILFKLQSLQKDVEHTYIASFVEDEEQYIIPNNQVVDEQFTTKKLNDDINIAVSKNKLFELNHFFEKTGLDYIFSPFSILNEHNIQNPESNALIILIYNNKLYALVVDAFAKVIFSKVLSITEFDDIQNSEFYDNLIMKQNLYDEVYQLELINNIKTIMNEFYEKHDLFIEKINILYTVKQLQREQIVKIQNELMLKVDYHPISMDEMVFEMIKTKELSEYNYTTPRVIKKSSKQSYMIILAILVVIGLIYYLISANEKKQKEISPQKQTIQKDEPKEIKKEQINEVSKPTLPNHVEKNTIVKELSNKLLGSVPYDMVLQKVEIEKDSCNMYATLITKDLFAKSLKDDLLELYENSQIEFIEKEQNKGEFKAIITSEKVKPLNLHTIKKMNYSKNIFLTRAQIESILDKNLPVEADLIFDSVFKSDIVTFNYKVVLVNTTPKQFFETIDKLNKLSNSIHINYPIVFEIKEDGLQIDFKLQVHQNK